MEYNKLVSVVMPVHNGEEFLHVAIESILEQTCKNFELIIVNDNSTDQSKRIIESFSDSRIKCIDNESNLGAFASYNVGVRNSSGKYIAFADQDDINNKNRLKNQYNFLKSNNSKVCASNFNIIDEYSKLITTTSIKISEDSLNEIIIYKPFVFHNPTVMIEKSLFMKHGMFDESIRIGADYMFYLKLSLSEELLIIDQPLYNWRYHRNSYTYVTKEKSYKAQKDISIKFLNSNINYWGNRNIEKYKALVYYYSDELLRSLYSSFVFLSSNGFDIKVSKNTIKILILGPIIKLLRYFNLIYELKKYL
jgi:glycosyltransferase involved in cell wall biosynthesis